MKNKKGAITLGEMPTAVMTLVVIGIFIAIGALIIASVQSNSIVDPGRTNATAAWNVTYQGLQGLNTIGSFQTVIAVVIAAAVILGVVFLIQR